MTCITWKTFPCKLKKTKNDVSQRHIEIKLQNYIVLYLDVTVFLCSCFADQKKQNKKPLPGNQM